MLCYLQAKYLCPPELLTAAIEFIHALWKGRRHTAMEVMRTMLVLIISVN